jgi:4-amino-4-deoxy-L-arabinose transferase-like glycosyltransferase
MRNAVVQLRSKEGFWLSFAVVAVAVIILAGFRWSLDHPYGIHWDEALYINEVQIDTQRMQHGMLLKLAGRILVKSWGRPPAYRILAVPFLALLGFHTTIARLVTLGCFGLSDWFIYLSARRIGSRAAGAFAALLFSLSPIVVSASIWFSTEGPLYLATSAMLYYVFVCWTDRSEQRNTWIGLGDRKSVV